jgi:ribonuclease P protein component
LIKESLSFDRNKRLRTKSDYQTVFSRPTSLRSQYFTFLALPNNRSHARLGIMVAKRVMKRAVDRNTARRVVRESFRLHQDLLAGLDIIVLVRCNFSDKPNRALYDCLKAQWKDLVQRSRRGSVS